MQRMADLLLVKQTQRFICQTIVWRGRIIIEGAIFRTFELDRCRCDRWYARGGDLSGLIWFRRENSLRMTMESLLKDGRIHPARIEEAGAGRTVRKFTISLWIRWGCCLWNGAPNLHPDLMKIKGRLQFVLLMVNVCVTHWSCQTFWVLLLASYENATWHDVQDLHDIGKGLTVKWKGSHVEIGQNWHEVRSIQLKRRTKTNQDSLCLVVTVGR